MGDAEWKGCQLGDVVSLVIDYRGKTPKKLGGDWSSSGYRALSAKNIKTGKIVQEESIRFVDEKLYKIWMKDEVERGDILITSEAPFGQIYYWDSEEKIVLSQRLFALRIKDKFFPKYIYYYMTSKDFQKELDGRATGTTVTGLRQPELMKCNIRYPSLMQQKEIAKILSSLDDKIELNNAINRNLEEQAQAIFKSWFVDFESFGGKMPEDWKLGKLGDVAEIKKKAFHPEKNPGLIVEHYSLPALDEKYYPVFEVADGIKSNKFVVSKESVLISKLNPDTKRIWRPYCKSENPICSTEFVVFESINGSHRDFLYSIIDSRQFYDFMGSLVTGCTNSHQRVSPETLLTFPIAIPPKTILKSFCDKITPIYEMIEKNVLENQRLANLRDSTLPKLMSGEIDSDKIAV